MLPVIFGATQATQSSNPIVPATGDVIWSVISFVVLLVILAKVAFPPVKKIMVQRTEKIRDDIEVAEQARMEAESVLAQYRSQLEEARRESTRLIDEARKTAEVLREDIVAQAHRDAAEIRQRAEDALAQERQRVVSEVKAELGVLAVDLAERIIEAEIERSISDPLVARFISEVGSSEQ